MGTLCQHAVNFHDSKMLDFSFYEKMENRSIPKSAKAVLDYFEAAEKVLSQPGGGRFAMTACLS